MAQDPSAGKLNEYNPGQPISYNDLFRDPAKYLNATSKSREIPGVAVPERNPQQVALAGQQLKASQDYLAHLKDNSDSLYNNVAQNARTNLAGTIRSTRNSFNDRGLLSSGGETAAELGATADTRKQLAGARSSINQGLLNTQTQMEGNAFGSAAGVASPGPNIAAPYLSGVGSQVASQMSDAQQSAAAFQGIGQGLGSVAGAGLAGSIYNQRQMPGQTPSYAQPAQDNYSLYGNTGGSNWDRYGMGTAAR
jgi:hypothetical protein